MKIGRSICAALTLTTILSPFACTSVTHDDESTESDLIGGTEAREGEFPSTLLVRGNCTVARVGPRHILTAAHCVYDNSSRKIRADFGPGRPLYLTNHIKADSYAAVDSNVFRTVRVKKVHLADAYDEEHTSIRPLGAEAIPDVAIMEITEESETALEGIPIAKVRISPMNVGDRVVMMGYGCEKGLKGPQDYTKQRLKYQRTRLLGIDSQDHAGSYVLHRGEPFTTNLERQYLFTPGAYAQPKEASLCPGDSGGPLYADDGTASTIVGVNAYYSFAPANANAQGNWTSVTNWHTRLDVESRFDVGSWLTSLGVATEGAKPSNHFDGCAETAEGVTVCSTFRTALSESKGALGYAKGVARYERTDRGRWAWSQQFEKKTLSITDDGELTDDAAPDSCHGQADGDYCGAHFGDPQQAALYRCSRGKIKRRVVCSEGCEVTPTEASDRCR